ncbi:MAG: mechanosensitive ion channel [Planctomycetaceae bacterium]|nr:mechanosensitive ion channel [Planctomycetaceae bacterium]
MLYRILTLWTRNTNFLAFQAPDLPSPEAQSSDATQASFTDTLLFEIQQYLTVDTLISRAKVYGPKILAAISVFILGRMAARFVTSMIVRGASRARMDETLSRFGGNVAYIILLTAVCIASLGCLGIDTSSLTAVLAAAGFAVGMALQGSLSNFASGVLLVFFKPFRVGDTVEVNGIRGRVVDIQIFSTMMLTPDNVRIFVPNSSVTSGTIQNFSAEPRRRIDLVIGCSYNDDIKAVKTLLQSVVTSDPRILKDPAPVVAVAELSDSSVNFVVRPWVTGKEYWDVRFSLIEAIKIGFDEQGFTIPFPSRDIFVHQSSSFEQENVSPAAIKIAA